MSRRFTLCRHMGSHCIMWHAARSTVHCVYTNLWHTAHTPQCCWAHLTVNFLVCVWVCVCEYARWRIYICAMTHVRMCHDSSIYVSWLLHIYVPWFFCECAPGLIHTCALTHSYMCHVASICVLWLIYTNFMTHPRIKICDMPHMYMHHNSSIYVPGLIHMCAMTHSYMSYNASTYVP